MGLGSIGFPMMVVILVVALLLFGPNKLPELGRAFGKTLREFKKGTRELMEDSDDRSLNSTQQAAADQEVDQQLETKRLPD